MILILAILESAAPSDAAFEPVGGGFAVTLIRLAWSGGVAVLMTLLGIVIVGPLHLLSRLAAGRA